MGDKEEGGLKNLKNGGTAPKSNAIHKHQVWFPCTDFTEFHKMKKMVNQFAANLILNTVAII